jgi:hypothetical protein
MKLSPSCRLQAMLILYTPSIGGVRSSTDIAHLYSPSNKGVWSSRPIMFIFFTPNIRRAQSKTGDTCISSPKHHSKSLVSTRIAYILLPAIKESESRPFVSDARLCSHHWESLQSLYSQQEKSSVLNRHCPSLFS